MCTTQIRCSSHRKNPSTSVDSATKRLPTKRTTLMARRKQFIADSRAAPQGQAMKQRKLSICYQSCCKTGQAIEETEILRSAQMSRSVCHYDRHRKESKNLKILVPKCRSEPRGETQALRAAHDSKSQQNRRKQRDVPTLDAHLCKRFATHSCRTWRAYTGCKRPPNTKRIKQLFLTRIHRHPRTGRRRENTNTPKPAHMVAAPGTGARTSRTLLGHPPQRNRSPQREASPIAAPAAAPAAARSITCRDMPTMHSRLQQSPRTGET